MFALDETSQINDLTESQQVEYDALHTKYKIICLHLDQAARELEAANKLMSEFFLQMRKFIALLRETDLKTKEA